MFDVQLSKQAVKFLSSCDKILSGRFTEKIDFLVNNPVPPDAKRLKGVSSWRIRVGDYRIIYEIHYDVKTVLITKIGHRSIIYD